MVFEHEKEYDSQWAAITSIAQKIGCTAETLRKLVRQAERDGRRPGVSTEERARLKELEPIGYMPPVEYEEAFYRCQDTQVGAAAIN